MSNFSWGVLGPGGIARAFAKDLSLLNGHSIGAVGSRSLSNAQSFATEFGGTAYGSYEELVNDSTIDAIYVATPHPAHHDNVILALNAGKPVLCEKPFAVNAVEAQSMVDAAKRNNVALMEAMWARFLPHYAKVREIISSGVLGPIQSIHADHGQRLADQGIPRLVQPELAGGALLDLGIYPISFAHMILGNPIDRTFYNPASMRVIMNDGKTTEYANGYKGHGLREQAEIFKQLVQSGNLESEILTWQDTVDIMKSMDVVRQQIGLKYPFEN